MFYDLIHISCLTSSKEATLKAVKLSQSKMRYPNLRGLPVLLKRCFFTGCMRSIMGNPLRLSLPQEMQGPKTLY